MERPLNADSLTSPREKLNKYLPSLGRQQKGSDFVLNCDSSEWKLPEYNSFYDNHLKYFFANPKVRSVLVETGMIDKAGNIYKDRSKTSNFPCSTKMSRRLKLDPLPQNANMAIQRIILPYKARKPKSKAQSFDSKAIAPIRRALTLSNNLNKPKTIESMISKGRSLASMRNVQPISKYQSAEVITKYHMKNAKPNQTSGTDDSTVAEEGAVSPNDRKSDFSISSKSKPLQDSGLEDRKIMNSSIDILESNKKNELDDYEAKEIILTSEGINKKMNVHLNEEGDFQLLEAANKEKRQTNEEILAKVEKN